jgi:hypothetical protein
MIFQENLGYERVPRDDEFVDAAFRLCGEEPPRSYSIYTLMRVIPRDVARQELAGDIMLAKMKSLAAELDSAQPPADGLITCDCACHRPPYYDRTGGCVHCILIG